MAISLSQFVARYNGKSLDFDHYAGYQCVDLIEFYLRDCFGSKPFWGNAKDFYYKFGTPLNKYFTKVTNDPRKPNQLPPVGSIVVWGGNSPGSGGYGHVDVNLGANVKGFTGFDQNWNGAYAHKVSHNYNYIVGWLAPKATAKPSTPPKAVAQYYTVRSGDYLGKIAGMFRTSLTNILRLNPSIKNPNVIQVNQKIRVK